MYAYAHTPLDEDTIKLTSFSSGDKLFQNLTLLSYMTQLYKQKTILLLNNYPQILHKNLFLQ